MRPIIQARNKPGSFTKKDVWFDSKLLHIQHYY